MELRIDPEFEKKIPPLTAEEFRQLEENILADGLVINPLIIWNGVIVDGHKIQMRKVDACIAVSLGLFE